MKRARLSTSIVCVMLLLSSVALAQDEGALTIEVKNAWGQPVKNACVTVIPKDGEIVFRKSDRNGKVKVKNVARGSYRVVVKAGGYAAQKREVAVESNTDAVTFQMQAREQR